MLIFNVTIGRIPYPGGTHGAQSDWILIPVTIFAMQKGLIGACRQFMNKTSLFMISLFRSAHVRTGSRSPRDPVRERTRGGLETSAVSIP